MESIELEKKEKISLIDDLLLEILRRLPVQSLHRFRHVSKAWRAIISDDPNYRKYLPQPMHGFFYDVHPRYCATSNNVDRDHLISNAPFNFKSIKNICNGLILCSCLPAHASVRNPATKMLARIPRRHEDPIVMIAVAWDPLLSRHFHVVGYSVVTNVIHIFWSKTGEWVEGPRQCLDGWYSPWPDPPVFFAGIIHLLFDHSSSMLQIDPERVTCKRTDLPVMISDFEEHRLGVSRGKMHYALRKRMDIHVFVMEDYDGNKWKLEHTINLETVIREHLQYDEYESKAERFIERLDHRDLILAFHPDLDEIFLSLPDGVVTCSLHDAAFTVVVFNRQISAGTFWIYSPCYVEDLDLECVKRKRTNPDLKTTTMHDKKDCTP